jgi:hypothetical protein
MARTSAQLLGQSLNGEATKLRVFVADRPNFLEHRRIAVSLKFFHVVPSYHGNARFRRVTFDRSHLHSCGEKTTAGCFDGGLSFRSVLFQVSVNVRHMRVVAELQAASARWVIRVAACKPKWRTRRTMGSARARNWTHLGGMMHREPQAPRDALQVGPQDRKAHSDTRQRPRRPLQTPRQQIESGPAKDGRPRLQACADTEQSGRPKTQLNRAAGPRTWLCDGSQAML